MRVNSRQYARIAQNFVSAQIYTYRYVLIGAVLYHLFDVRYVFGRLNHTLIMRFQSPFYTKICQLFFCEHLFQELSRIALFYFRDLFGRARADDRSAARTPFGA